MAVSRMKRFSLVGLLRDKQSIIDRLQKSGMVHISDYEEVCQMKEIAEDPNVPGKMSDSLEDLTLSDPEQVLRSDAEYNRINEERDKLRRCIEELAPFDERKKSFFSFLRPVSEEDVCDAGQRRENILAEADKIIATDQNVKEAEEYVAKLETRLNSVKPWDDLPYSPKTSETRFTVTDYLSAESTGEIDELIANVSEDAPSADVWVLDNKYGFYPFVLTCLRDEHPFVEKAYASSRVVRYDFSDIGTAPAEYAVSLEKEIEQQKQKISDLLEFRKEAARHISDFEILYDYLGIRSEKMKADISMSDSTVTFRLEGWIPARAEKTVTRELTDDYICHIESREPDENELPPTKLENGFVGSSVEPVESMYSLLKYGELDPSAISAFFYALFFGFMFSDAGYGIILTIACIVILLKCKLKTNMKKNVTLFLFSGISIR